MILSRSLDRNYLGYKGDMSPVIKLAEVLPQTKLQTLRCLPAKCSRSLLASAVSQHALPNPPRVSSLASHARLPLKALDPVPSATAA